MDRWYCWYWPPTDPRARAGAALLTRGRQLRCRGSMRRRGMGNGLHQQCKSPTVCTGSGCSAHRPRGRADNHDPTHSAEGRTGDCPGPRNETNEGEGAMSRRGTGSPPPTHPPTYTHATAPNGPPAHGSDPRTCWGTREHVHPQLQSLPQKGGAKALTALQLGVTGLSDNRRWDFD